MTLREICDSHSCEDVYVVRFQVLTATGMNMTVDWDLAPCSLVEIYRRFRGAYCFLHEGAEENILT
jgi:hypothetical protein